ncbi:MAG: hypothetical protein AB1345_07125 [Chloroflexota bacterium]
MTNPPLLQLIKPAFEELGKQVDILPATGGAVEELQVPDQEELEDILINRENREITAFAETPQPTLATLYRPTPPLPRNEKHLYRFFIDGSLRTYYLGTGIEGNRSFPIELAQIGAAVMRRDDNGKVKLLGVKTSILLLLPKGQFGVSDSVWNQLIKLNTSDGFFSIVDTTERTINTPGDPTVENLRNRAGGIARNRMHRLEIELISLTDGLRNEDNWLILDGAVKLDEFIDSPNLIGVAKNFRKDPQFYFGRTHKHHKDITSILAGLPYAHRTAAFSTYQGKVAFWYVRLREQKEVDYPLMGVVKVEIPRPDITPIESELADLLSRVLVAERSVTPHGRDQRWHSLIYPIFQAEQSIKNQFYSRQVLMGIVKWPRRRLS